MWGKRPLKDRYQVVIIGGGVHGVSTAYYLTKLGIKDIAVLDKGYLGGGASARTTAIIRANYITVEGIPFFNESLKLYEGLAKELNFNILFNQMGRLDLGHTDAAVYGLRMRTEFNRLLGVDSRMVGPKEVKDLVPPIDLREGKPFPILGALYHPPCGVVRHDAVVWGFARGANNGGVELHPFTEVTGIDRTNGHVSGVETSRGFVQADTVLSTTAGWSSTIAAMVDLKLPLTTHPLEVMVTEPLKPFLHKTISSANLHAYVYQTDRGEVVIGGGVDPYQSYSQRSSLRPIEELAAHTLEMFPCMGQVKVLRQWSGLCDMSPDYAPIMGTVQGLDGFVLSCGWGSWGFKAAPAAGKSIAQLISTGETPDLIKPFGLSRFHTGRLVNERAAAPAAAIH
ncbi:MAG TPA: FAD-dependent oxidoreductase [Dehalococcoidia bacterium]|nr:FAD-dependent oxidoreductase [Dehalococcoidia bacterium]HIM80938.1 FAD-dependent oxidoreductase [Dehalococcoidia bacterium]